MLLRQVWIYGWITLVVFNVVALLDVSTQTCGYMYPILLSRALTTDPYRGITLGYCLLAIAMSFSINSSFLLAGFLGFFSAFLVSMFETNAHNALILVSSILVLYECTPPKSSTNTIWNYHWRLTIVSGMVCNLWLVYAQLLCKTQACERCSQWYISEYVLFWSMYLLVYWRIPAVMVVQDTIVRSTTPTLKDSMGLTF
jgi:hypothetical protein